MTDPNPITLTRFILAETQHFDKATGDFAILLQSIQLACKAIASATRRIGIASMYGVADGQAENASGDTQKKLDVFSNELFINCLKFSKQVYLLCSEEEDHAIIMHEKKGGYAVVFDPLDGSSNIDANISVGTIFGIYKKDALDVKPTSEADALRPGTELVAAGYAMYGSSTTFILTTGNGVNGFMLDPAIGEFVLTHRNIRVPKKGSIYSINEGNAASWDAATTELVRRAKTKQPNGKGPKSARYVGSMVADVHRTLLYGGIFCYPADSKSPSGKLRLLYEANPMSMIVEQAGGKSSTGTLSSCIVRLSTFLRT
jgi:fructose-1,6-bisphosphatase I